VFVRHVFQLRYGAYAQASDNAIHHRFAAVDFKGFAQGDAGFFQGLIEGQTGGGGFSRRMYF
jgi:hypothetical protein